MMGESELDAAYNTLYLWRGKAELSRHLEAATGRVRYPGALKLAQKWERRVAELEAAART